MAGATGACNNGNMTLTPGQRPGNTDEDRQRPEQGERKHDEGDSRGVVCQLYCYTAANSK